MEKKLYLKKKKTNTTDKKVCKLKKYEKLKKYTNKITNSV